MKYEMAYQSSLKIKVEIFERDIIRYFLSLYNDKNIFLRRETDEYMRNIKFVEEKCFDRKRA